MEVGNMETTISNKCKYCRWLKIDSHNADYSRGGGKCTQPYRVAHNNICGRYFSSIACKYFEKGE